MTCISVAQNSIASRRVSDIAQALAGHVIKSQKARRDQREDRARELVSARKVAEDRTRRTIEDLKAAGLNVEKLMAAGGPDPAKRSETMAHSKHPINYPRLSPDVLARILTEKIQVPLDFTTAVPAMLTPIAARQVTDSSATYTGEADETYTSQLDLLAGIEGNGWGPGWWGSAVSGWLDLEWIFIFTPPETRSYHIKATYGLHGEITLYSDDGFATSKYAEAGAGPYGIIATPRTSAEQSWDDTWFYHQNNLIWERGDNINKTFDLNGDLTIESDVVMYAEAPTAIFMGLGLFYNVAGDGSYAKICFGCTAGGYATCKYIQIT